MFLFTVVIELKILAGEFVSSIVESVITVLLAGMTFCLKSCLLTKGVVDNEGTDTIVLSYHTATDTA
jgi:hypothetical protein